MSIRTLFAMLVAVAVLLAPAFSRGGEARAATPDHHQQMMEAGHCQMMPADPGDDGKVPQKSCCMAMCTALAIEPARPAEDEAIRAPAPQFALRTIHVAVPPEIATPPPRAA